LYYRGASVILIVYDISNRNTFTSGVNKFDLAISNREVTENEARKYAEDIGAMFYETSAKTGHNVNMIFGDIASRLEKSESKSLLAVKALPRRSEKDLSLKIRKEFDDSADSGFQNHKLVKKCCHV